MKEEKVKTYPLRGFGTSQHLVQGLRGVRSRSQKYKFRQQDSASCRRSLRLKPRCCHQSWDAKGAQKLEQAEGERGKAWTHSEMEQEGGEAVGTGVITLTTK